MLLLLSLWLSCQAGIHQVSDICEMRMRFHQIDSRKSLEGFLAYSNRVKDTCAIPFRAAAIMQKAKYERWPVKKYKYFKDGQKQLEDYLKRYPNCIDGHYVRLLVQSESPGFLGYSEHMESDLAFIRQHLPDSLLSEDYQKMIRTNINQIHQKIQP